MKSPDNLTLRSIAQRCVSKGGNAHLACCPSFETRRFAALLRMRLSGLFMACCFGSFDFESDSRDEVVVEVPERRNAGTPDAGTPDAAGAVRLRGNGRHSSDTVGSHIGGRAGRTSMGMTS